MSTKTTMLSAPDIFYVASFILVGSAIATYLINFITSSLKPLSSSKAGRAVKTTLQKSFERCLDVLSVSDPLSPPSSPTSQSTRGYLEHLPQRRGPRPQVEGVSSPVQTTQRPPWEQKDVDGRLRDLIIDLANRYPLNTYLGRSTFEPASSTSLYARHRIFNKTKYYGEIVSANATDFFIHATLHPSDVKIMIERGWGQRDPLSGRFGSLAKRLISGAYPGPVTGSQVLIYAPRHNEDLDVIKDIIDAAVWWVGGIEHKADEESF